ncbi:carboxypeptidase-like regulatory domain-containing protein [Bacteroidales bacterium OttesenSCG-928-I21]|nr:carboxypeptidase-like regulatory domain-containing protein [Bacteroidales bacterium OttesenSCG-928-I21]
MRTTILTMISILSINFSIAQNQDIITISGKVTDFYENPIDSSTIQLLHRDFSVAYETYSDKNGNYTLKDIPKGVYMAMFAMRTKEYPTQNAVFKDKMRLEYWAWNVIADKDLTISPRYDRLELYGTTVFEIYGGYSGLFIYFRPMSLTKYIASFLDENKTDNKNIDISVKPENLDIEIYADDELLKINSIQTIQEYTGENGIPMIGYIVQVDMPKTKSENSYTIIKIVGENKEYGEKGENIYFYEFDKFK